MLPSNQSPLHEAIEANDFLKTKQLLDNGADPNNVSPRGGTPIFYAICVLNLDIFKLLLDHPNIDVNAACSGDVTPLHLTTCNGYIYLTTLLLEHKDININLRNNIGRTPLEEARFDYCAFPKQMLNRPIFKQVRKYFRHKIEAEIRKETKLNKYRNVIANLLVQAEENLPALQSKLRLKRICRESLRESRERLKYSNETSPAATCRIAVKHNLPANQKLTISPLAKLLNW